ncbi:MAG: hypothetical protein ACTHPD_10915, partial [Rhizomicrobium sp.]
MGGGGESWSLRLLWWALLRLMLLRLLVLTRLGHREGAQSTDDEGAGDAGSDHSATKALKRLCFLVHSA